MSSIIKSNFHVFSATKFLESYSSNSASNLYLFIGRPYPWVSDSSPDTPLDSVSEERSYWNDMIAMKRVTPSDVKHVARKINWNSGQVFDQYDSYDANLYNRNFYVVTNENNVYKCLANNYGGASIIKPTGIGNYVIETSDGYKWKYLYTLEDNDLLKFNTDLYMAVNKNLSVSSVTTNGSIEHIQVTNSGAGYSNVANLNVSIIGDGINASATPIVSGSSNIISKINITNIGNGYTFANIVISGGGGTGATAKAMISPPGGHGSNPIYELDAKYIMLNTRLDFAEGNGDFPATNEYRRIGLISNPISSYTNLPAQETTLNATYQINLSGFTANLTLDEYVVGTTSNANIRVVDFRRIPVADVGYVRYIQGPGITENSNNFITNELVIGKSSGVTGDFLQKINPEVVHNTGKILFAENRRPITRASDQSENIHIVIEF